MVDLGIKENIQKFHDATTSDRDSNNWSWKFCYDIFGSLRPDSSDEQVDQAALLLAYYLASWGMYRGSSHLRDKNYRALKGIVRELASDVYRPIVALDVGVLPAASAEVGLVFKGVARLEALFDALGVSPTATLVTKVLLGTLACVPAYDTYLYEGMRYRNHASNRSGENGLNMSLGPAGYGELIEFYQRHREEFEEAQDEMVLGGLKYPAMKLVDMYFWQVGNQVLKEKAAQEQARRLQSPQRI